MIDVKVTNSKLLDRGVGIVAQFAKCDRDMAKKAILKAIHECDELPESIANQVRLEITVFIIKATISSNVQLNV